MTAGARIDFKSRLGLSGDAEVAALQVSTDSGVTWSTLWSQAGGGEETTFSAKTATLEAFAGQIINIRFLYDFLGGNAVPLPDDPSDPLYNRIGWYIDDINIINAPPASSAVESAVLASPQFIFRPNLAGTYLLEFQALNGARSFEYGPAKTVTVQSNPPTVSLFNTIATRQG